MLGQRATPDSHSTNQERTMRPTSIFVSASAAIALVALGTLVLGQAPKEEAQGKFPFGTKVLVISLKSDAESGATLEKAELRRVGDQAFLVGTAVDDGGEGNWSKGRTTWVPL